MILWEPITDAEKKLLELYAVEEEDIKDHDQHRSHRGRKEFDKACGMCKEEV